MSPECRATFRVVGPDWSLDEANAAADDAFPTLLCSRSDPVRILELGRSDLRIDDVIATLVGVTYGVALGKTRSGGYADRVADMV